MPSQPLWLHQGGREREREREKQEERRVVEAGRVMEAVGGGGCRMGSGKQNGTKRRNVPSPDPKELNTADDGSNRMIAWLECLHWLVAHG